MGAFFVKGFGLERRQDEGTTGGTPGGGEATPPGGGTPGGGGGTPSGGAGETPPPGGGTPSGGGEAPPGGVTTLPPSGAVTLPPSGAVTTAPPSDGPTSLPGGGTTIPPGGDGTTIPSGGGTTIPDGGTTPLPGGETTTTPGGETTTTPVPPNGDTTTTTIPGGDTTTTTPNRNGSSTSRSTTTAYHAPTDTWEPHKSSTWIPTSTWCPPEFSSNPQLAVQPTFTGTTVIEGTTWVQTTLDTPLTTVYTSESLYTERGQAMTKYIPVTTVIPPGTVVIRHNLAVDKKSSSLIPAIAGALGGVAALILLGVAGWFIVKRRREREARNIRIDIDPTPNNPSYPGLPPTMSQNTGQSLVQPTLTGGSSSNYGSTGYGGVVGSQTQNALMYPSAGRPSMDAPTMRSSMYVSTNYSHNTSPDIGNGVHYRSPSALSEAPSVTHPQSHIGHYRGESATMPIQENDPLLGPFSDNNRVPTPSSVMPLVHEDGGRVGKLDLNGQSYVLPPYDGAR